MHVPITLAGLNRKMTVAAMIDSGASTLFISQKLVKTHEIRTRRLEQPIQLLNIDGTPNRAGQITHVAPLQMTIGTVTEHWEFVVTDLGPEDVVLGIEWLKKMNPCVNWKEGTVEMEEPQIEQVRLNREKRRLYTRKGLLEDNTNELWVSAGYTYSQQIAEAAGTEKQLWSLEEIVPLYYRDFDRVFSETESERLPKHQSWDHSIDLKEGAPDSIRSKVYPMAVNEQSELDAFLEENRRKGYITPSKSPMSSPVFFIKKKDGKLRLIQDYRKLNEITVKNRYPLPLAADVINQLRGAKYFTKFDVRWGYNNVRIKKGDEWKAAFATNRGLFEPTVMFFGLTNSPATFQSLMNAIFADLVAGQKVIVYLDDILIYSTDLEEHREVVREVLKRLQDHDLYLRPEKCEFKQTKVEYLGMVISEGKVEMDPSKVEAITSWPIPNTLRELRGFIGFANFYRRFIQNFSRICRPLHDLTKQGQPWTWGTEQDEAFRELKGNSVRPQFWPNGIRTGRHDWK
jgi:predicted aspartyl protease